MRAAVRERRAPEVIIEEIGERRVALQIRVLQDRATETTQKTTVSNSAGDVETGENLTKAILDNHRSRKIHSLRSEHATRGQKQMSSFC